MNENPLTKKKLSVILTNLMESLPLKSKPRSKHGVYIKSAKDECLRSSMRQRHGACLVYQRKVVATGCTYRSEQCPSRHSIHAEESVIKEFLRQCTRNGYPRSILKDCTLYVIRIGRENDTLKLSKPCKNCTKTMIKYKIPKVYFSIGVFDILNNKT